LLNSYHDTFLFFSDIMIRFYNSVFSDSIGKFILTRKERTYSVRIYTRSCYFLFSYICAAENFLIILLQSEPSKEGGRSAMHASSNRKPLTRGKFWVAHLGPLFGPSSLAELAPEIAIGEVGSQVCLASNIGHRNM
jgi:hypothetical protein